MRYRSIGPLWNGAIPARFWATGPQIGLGRDTVRDQRLASAKSLVNRMEMRLKPPLSSRSGITPEVTAVGARARCAEIADGPMLGWVRTHAAAGEERLQSAKHRGPCRRALSARYQRVEIADVDRGRRQMRWRLQVPARHLRIDDPIRRVAATGAAGAPVIEGVAELIEGR